MERTPDNAQPKAPEESDGGVKTATYSPEPDEGGDDSTVSSSLETADLFSDWAEPEQSGTARPYASSRDLGLHVHDKGWSTGPSYDHPNYEYFYDFSLP